MSDSSGNGLSTALWVRTQQLFDAALELPPTARDEFLQAQCTDAPTLREAVLRLLEAHHRLGASDQVPGATAMQQAVAQWTAPSALPSGTRIGDFTVVRELGVGGMGAVYLAERDIDGHPQPVALKLAQVRELGAGLLDRLRRERRILAGLEHPHVARLIDAGELADGTPYFAMEYVEGVAITRYADANRLDLDARLRLLLQVIDAVQHAHQSLVVHRDIKPANVLVTAAGVAKLLDFGIAKPLAQAGDAALTGDAQRFFSPMSAAPEQVQGGETGIGTDVYALGVLCYELLAGSTPFDFSGLRRGEIERHIIEVVPPLPSQSVDALARRDPIAAAEVAAVRDLSSAAALRQRLRDDLDAVVARALRKLPRERYPSVERLGQDLRAVLDCRPIEQRLSDRAYRLRKFARRHALPLGLGTIAGLLLVTFVVTTVMQNARIAQQRDLAQARQQQAEDERNRAEQVSKFLIGLFRASDPENARGHEITARELLERGAKGLNSELGQQPKIRAALMATIGDIYLALNDFDGARRYIEQAAKLRETELDNEPLELADSRRQQAQTALSKGGYAEAIARVDEALALVAPDGALARDTLLPLRAQALQAVGSRADAIALWRSIRDQQMRAYGATDTRTLTTTRRLAYALRAKGELKEAMRLLSETLAQQDAELPPDHPERAHLLHHRALLAIDLRDFVGAERDARQAAEIYGRVFGEGHSYTAGIYNTLGIIANGRGDVRAATVEFEHSLAITRTVFGAQHPRVASAEYNLGLLLHAKLGDAQAAEPHLREAVEIAIAVLPEDHTNLAQFRLAWGRVLRDLGQAERAERELRAALRVFQAHYAPPGVDVASAQGELACLQLATRKDPAVEQSLRAASALVSAELEPEDSQRRRLASCVARL